MAHDKVWGFEASATRFVLKLPLCMCHKENYFRTWVRALYIQYRAPTVLTRFEVQLLTWRQSNSRPLKYFCFNYHSEWKRKM